MPDSHQNRCSFCLFNICQRRTLLQRNCYWFSFAIPENNTHPLLLVDMFECCIYIISFKSAPLNFIYTCCILPSRPKYHPNAFNFFTCLVVAAVPEKFLYTAPMASGSKLCKFCFCPTFILWCFALSQCVSNSFHFFFQHLWHTTLLIFRFFSRREKYLKLLSKWKFLFSQEVSAPKNCSTDHDHSH